MATRQYIGARYVPKFYENSAGTAEWRSGVIYEPLTIVTWNGNSYTSKKAVPAEIGDPSSNPAYWVATGLFNEQIAALSGDVDAIETRMDSAETTLNRLVAGRKFIFIADSYGTGEGSEGPVNSFIDRCTVALGLTENVDYWKNAVGGASFHGWNGRRSFRSLLEEVTPTDNAYITDVVVCGGINDAATGADLSSNITAMEDFVTYARGRFPNAVIHVCFLGWTTGVNTNLNIVNMSLPAYRYAGEKGAAFVNLNCLNHDYHNHMTDGSHPTSDGAKCIGWGLASYLAGGSPIDGGMRYRTLNLTKNDSVVDSGTPNIQQFIDDRSVYVSVGKASLTLASGVVITTDTEFELATINYNNYLNSIVELGSPKVKIAIFGSPAVQYCDAILRFDAANKKLFIRPFFPTAFTATTRIIIFPGNCGAIPLEWC